LTIAAVVGRMRPVVDRAVHLITGIQAAGKSSVAQALAERLAGPTVHVHGDTFRRWVINGRAEMTSDPSPRRCGSCGCGTR
jgi:chloramphenicol 3-O-phosphotransferase